MGVFARKKKAVQSGKTTATPFCLAPQGRVAIRHAVSGNRLQAKMTVGAPDDAYDREADRVADQVIRMPDTPELSNLKGPESIQRICEGCEEKLQRQPLEKEKDVVLQTEAKSGLQVNQGKTVETGMGLPDSFLAGSAKIYPGEETKETRPVPPNILELQGAGNEGKPLPTALRSHLEPFYDCSFKDVRVHDGSRSAELSRRLDARAFTYQHNIYFGAGEFQPLSSSGKRLLAHELTHVAQHCHTPAEKTTARSKASAPLLRRKHKNVPHSTRTSDSVDAILDENGLIRRSYEHPGYGYNTFLYGGEGEKPCPSQSEKKPDDFCKPFKTKADAFANRDFPPWWAPGTASYGNLVLAGAVVAAGGSSVASRLYSLFMVAPVQSKMPPEALGNSANTNQPDL